jgi:TolB-like protein
MIDRIRQAWSDLRGHPAFRAGVVYAGAAFVVLQVMDVLAFSAAVIRAAGALLLIGFVAVLAGTALAHRSHGGRRLLARLPRGRWLGLAALVLFLSGGAAWLLGGRLSASPVVPGAERIAVLPFSAPGAGTGEGLGEGMVDLLSASLDQVGGITTVHPRTVMSRWEARANGATVDLAGSLELGRELEAGSVLLGSLVGTGDRVRIVAELFRTDGRRIGEARTEGAADSVLELVDDLAVRILREAWRSREPIPSLRLAAITTASVDALRHYLRGEQHFRASRWDSAIAEFSEAVRIDSTFALAYLRLSESHGWAAGMNTAGVVDNARTAARLAERLPVRERRLARAHLMHEQGQLVVLDSLRDLLRAYPDDPMGWYLLADARAHARLIRPFTESELTGPVDSVLALDPGLVFPITHVMEYQFDVGDSVEYFGWLDRYRAAGAADTVRHIAAGRLRWAPPDSFPERFGRGVGSLSGQDLPFWFLWLRVPLIDPDYDPAVTLDALDRLDPERQPAVSPPLLAQARIRVLLALGRVDEAVAVAREARESDVPWPYTVLPFWEAALVGMLPLDAVLDHVPAENEPTRRLIRSTVLLARARPDAVASIQDIDPDGELLPGLQPVLERLEAWVPLQRDAASDTTDLLRRGLEAMGYTPMAMEPALGVGFHLGTRLAASDATRAEGISRLEALREGYFLPGVILPATALELARAYEAADEHDRAAREYAQVVRLWSEADSVLQPRVDEARRGLERVTREGRPR